MYRILYVIYIIENSSLVTIGALANIIVEKYGMDSVN